MKRWDSKDWLMALAWFLFVLALIMGMAAVGHTHVAYATKLGVDAVIVLVAAGVTAMVAT